MNARTVQHLIGHLKKELAGEDQQELLALIEDCRQEPVPLIVPIALLKRHLRR